MSLTLDNEVDYKKREAIFRAAFIERLPVGSVVENTFLATELGQKFFGKIAEG